MDPVLEFIFTWAEPLNLLIGVAERLTKATAEGAISMTSKAYVAHHIPGQRIRLRVPHRKGDKAFFDDVETRLNGIPGIKAATTPHTGSILIQYEGDLQKLLLSGLETGLDDLIDLEMRPEPLEPVADRLLNQAGAIEQKLLASTGGQMDSRSLVTIALIVAAGLQLLRGQVFGPAIPLLWYTAETIRTYARGASRKVA